MNKAKVFGKDNLPRIEYVPRQLPPIPQKIQPIDIKEDFPSTTNNNALFLDSRPSASLKHYTTSQPTIQNTDDDNDKSNIQRLTSPNLHQPPSSTTDNLTHPNEIKASHHGFSNWFSRLTPTQKIVFKLIIASGIILSIAAATVLPIYFFVIRQSPVVQSSFTNTTASVCPTSTCIGEETPYRTSMVTAFYAFDGNVNDQSGYATGTSFGTSFTGGYIGQALNLASASSQYLQIPNINFAKQSFTLEAWINPLTPSTVADYGIFGQCDSNMKCLSLSLRNARIVLSFDSMNTTNNTLTGSSVLVSTWVHVAVVYDATLFQQRIYVNGLIDAVSSGIVHPYQGISSTSITTIGKTSSFAYTNSYFNGRIDEFTISAGVVRSDCEILNDASLVVRFPFDTTATLDDYSVNLCNGIAPGTTTISAGRVDQAISFTSNSSYFQAPCFPRMRSNYFSYSFSLWVNPNSTLGGGTLVHISGATNGITYCYDVLAFTATGNLVFQWMLVTTAVVGAEGPVIPANTWTHVAVVYSVSNDICLYINGQFSASSSYTTTFNAYDTNAAIYPLYITLGNMGALGPIASTNCLTGTIPIASGSFAGAIDEFRLYNRELDNEELCVLANP